MTTERKNVWELGSDWAEPILWYARGVKALKARPRLDDPLSWRFWGAIHGFNKERWTQLGYLQSSDKIEFGQYGEQCQHGSWFFLPWHRGYVLAFEALVRDAIVKLGSDKNWALPYWNYFKPDQYRLPPAFATADWPDGKGDNPLYVPQRYGPKGDGNVYVDMSEVNQNALGEPNFTGVENGGSTGFGGVETAFAHSGRHHGGIETQPHDWVHGLVGGEDVKSGLEGAMADPDTAGLDPIFWLHHCNIDRLWEVWRRSDPIHTDPAQAAWKNGPASIGERDFVMPKPNGEAWIYTPEDMVDIAKLGYAYDDLSPAAAAQTPLVRRLQTLGTPVAAMSELARSAAIAHPKTTELLGANAGGVRLVGDGADVAVTLDSSIRNKVTSSLRAAARESASAPPDRVFLNLENVRGRSNATAFHVYVNVPPGDDPARHPELKAGSIALFGVRKASMPDGEHAGNGLSYVLDISHVMDALHVAGQLDKNQLQVRLVPVKPVPEDAQVQIGRVSVVRSGS